jgi:hypothetical protein
MYRHRPKTWRDSDMDGRGNANIPATPSSSLNRYSVAYVDQTCHLCSRSLTSLPNFFNAPGLGRRTDQFQLFILQVVKFWFKLSNSDAELLLESFSQRWISLLVEQAVIVLKGCYCCLKTLSSNWLKKSAASQFFSNPWMMVDTSVNASIEKRASTSSWSKHMVRGRGRGWVKMPNSWHGD